MNELEEKIAHLERLADDLSAIVADQANDISRLKAQIKLLLEREASREADGGVILGDEKPPHW